MSRRSLALAGAAVAALLLTGCGGSGSSSASSGGPTTLVGTEVRIDNFAFVPATVTIAVGGTVTWDNVDITVHDVKFSSGGIPTSPLLLPGKGLWSHTFTKAGTYHYICAIHPDMTGTVVVSG